MSNYRLFAAIVYRETGNIGRFFMRRKKMKRITDLVLLLSAFCLFGCNFGETPKHRQEEDFLPYDSPLRVNYERSGTSYSGRTISVSKAKPESAAKENLRTKPVIERRPAKPVIHYTQGQTADLSTLTPETSFSNAIDMLRNSVEPPLKIFVNWRDLSENADVDRSTPINMNGMNGIKVRKTLELILESVSGGFSEIDYVIDDGVITIATKDSLPSRMRTTVYDVTDLLGAPGRFATDIYDLERVVR